MADQPPSDRFKSEMPQIPGVNTESKRPAAGVNPAARLAGGLLLVLVIAFFVARIVLHTKHADSSQPDAAPQIILPTPESELAPAVPTSTDSEPGVATLQELAKPWASKNFFFRNRLTGEDVPSLVVHLGAASTGQPSAFWAFSLQAPFGNCHLEYLTDISKLQSDYGFRAQHPMVGNPCSRSVFDPLKLTNLPGNIWVRGGIAQGSDIRPPIGIEVAVRGKEILAIRME